MTMTSEQLQPQVHAYARDLREASDETRRASVARAETEHGYKKAWAVAYAQSTGDSHAARAQAADSATVDLKRDRDLAEGLWKAAIESERSKRAIVSAWQTYVSFAKTEAELARG